MNLRDKAFHAAIPVVAALFLMAIPVHAQQREPKLDPAGEIRRLEQIHREGAASASNALSGEDVRGRQEWWAFQRRFPYDLVPAGQRIEALRLMQRQTAELEQAMHGKHWNAGVLAANRWEEIGPFNISGRTRAFAFKPGDPGTMYIGAAAGGLWVSTDQGATWHTTTDTLSSLAVCSIDIDPSNTNVIYIGTGENSQNVDAYSGNGVFKSTDGGVTWKGSGLESAGAVSKLVVHRQHPNIIYAAVVKGTSGFYRSEDGGATWTQTIRGVDIWDISINPGNADEMFITTVSSIRRSTDGGKTFTTVTNSNGITLSRSLRISVAVSPAQPARVYALVARDPGTGGNHIGEAYVTNNSGASWELKKTFETSFFNEQGWYDNCVAADPADPDVALMGGIDIFRTPDGGASWVNTTRSYTGGNVHPDQHVLAFDATIPGVVGLGNDGGCYLSLDGGGTWEKKSTSLATSQFYAIEVDQTRQFRAYGGTQDNGTWGSNGTTDFPKNWKSVLSGDGFYVAVDQTDPNIVYAENFNGTPLYRVNTTTGQRSRIDNSISRDSESGDFGAWVTPIAMSPVDKVSLYTGRSKLYRSTNRGSSWDSLSPNAGGKIVAIGLSQFDAQKLMVGSTSSALRYTLDGGATWHTPTGVPSRITTDIVYDPVVQGRVYVTVSGFNGAHVYRSNDDGATFTNISSNLPDVSVNAMAVDPSDATHLFIGTDVGVYMSFDGGGSWVPFNNGLALAPVVDLRIHAQTHTLFAGTHGRSAWRVSITGLVPPPVLINPVGGQTYTTPGTIVVRWGNLSGPVKILISYDGGLTYQEVDGNAIGGLDSIQVGLVRSSMVRIKIVEIGGEGRVLESGNFSLTVPANCTDLGKRGFAAEAVEVRQGSIWATVRGSDSLYRLRLPLLGPRTGLLRTNIPGTVRDMAYDASHDLFYMLTAENDFSNPKLYRMDSNGVGLGQIPLPGALTHANGVAVTPEGIAVATPGSAPTIYILQDDGTLVRTAGPVDGASDNDRRSLVWDGLGFVQAVVRPDPSIMFPSQLQHISGTPALQVTEATTVIPPNTYRFDFVGLAFDPSNADINLRTYWGTDTGGTWCKCERQKFFTSAVDGSPAVTSYAARNLAIGAITPNPLRSDANIICTVRQRGEYIVEVFDAAGLRVAIPFSGSLDAGDHTIHIDASGLASGLYYVSLSSAAGERDARPLVVVR